MHTINHTTSVPKTNAGFLLRLVCFLQTLCVITCILTGCSQSNGQSGNQPGVPADKEQSVPSADSVATRLQFTVSAFDLDELISCGLPLILNFGDDGKDSLDTMAALEKLQEEVGHVVRICSVDLVENPQGKEGFPVQVLPTQFFYTAEGLPIPLPVNISVIMSTFMSVDTEEPVFTAHEGPLSYEGFLIILDSMGVITIM